MNITSSHLRRFTDRTEEAHVVVVGDLMLDRYFWGDVDRISPEAPVPVVHLQNETERPGGAANVAMNLAGLQLKTTVVGCVGKDQAGRRIADSLKKAGVETRGLYSVLDRPTTQKTRVVGDGQQMIRLDDESTVSIDDDTARKIVECVSELIGEADVLILSDYAKGVLTTFVCEQIIEKASAQDCPVLVDPKGTNYSKYAGASIVTPNDRELSAATESSADDTEALFEAGKRLRQDLDVEHLVVTRGEEGISHLSYSGRSDYPAVAQEVFDVSGAGDTVVATIAAAQAAQLGWEESIQIANLAASVVIGRVGTVPIRREDLVGAARRRQEAASNDKIYGRDRIQEKVAAWKSSGKSVVFTNGCFDLLHVGHVTYLEKARKKGDRLIVGLNTDQSVRALKGEPRPIIPEEQRARILASLESVDAVVFFEEETPKSLIEEICPDVLVKGADYKKSDVVGASIVEDSGGTVELIPLVDGVSTSEIIEDVKDFYL